MIDEIITVPAEWTTNGARLCTFVRELLNRYISDDAAIHVDSTGCGSSALDHLEAWLGSHRVVPYLGAARSKEIDAAGHLRFANWRSQTIWGLREKLDPSNPARLLLPPDQKLFADLTAPVWLSTGRGIQVEPKEKVMAKLGRSPDQGDAVAMAAQTWAVGHRWS